jgi:hypothetical protein
MVAGKFRGCLVGPIRRLVWVTAGRVPIQPAQGRSPRPGYQASSTWLTAGYGLGWEHATFIAGLEVPT